MLDHFINPQHGMFPGRILTLFLSMYVIINGGRLSTPYKLVGGSPEQKMPCLPINGAGKFDIVQSHCPVHHLSHGWRRTPPCTMQSTNTIEVIQVEFLHVHVLPINMDLRSETLGFRGGECDRVWGILDALLPLDSHTLVNQMTSHWMLQHLPSHTQYTLGFRDGECVNFDISHMCSFLLIHTLLSTKWHRIDCCNIFPHIYNTH